MSCRGNRWNAGSERQQIMRTAATKEGPKEVQSDGNDRVVVVWVVVSMESLQRLSMQCLRRIV